jgi:hypothetical protein
VENNRIEPYLILFANCDQVHRMSNERKDSDCGVPLHERCEWQS